MQTERLKDPGVQFPPPTLFVIAIFGGAAIESVAPMPLSTLVSVPGQPVIGWSAFVIGCALLVWAMMTFVRGRTPIYPNQPARQLVAHGPYRFSRNPMYVALNCITIGVGLLADNLWMLLLIPVVLCILTVFVIPREEAYLADAFGIKYQEYSSRVRRWL